MKVYIDGMYSFTRVRNNNDLRQFGAGVTLETLTAWGMNRDQVWIVSRPLKIITEDAGQRTSYLFGPPYLTDLASIPKRLRGAIDNDDIRLIAPALVHDYNFATHAMSFRSSNELFRKMIRAVGGSWLKAFICWLSVSSPFGSAIYKNKNPDCAQYYKETCEVSRGFYA